MKRRQFLETIAASTAFLSLSRGQAETNPLIAQKIRESVPPAALVQEPAKKWTEALPLGNGRLGAMSFGNTASDRIQLNEDTVWSGGPYDPTNPKGPEALPEIRRLVFAGEYLEAHRLFGRTMFGEAIPQMQYQPLGDLWLTFPSRVESRPQTPTRD